MAKNSLSQRSFRHGPEAAMRFLVPEGSLHFLCHTPRALGTALNRGAFAVFRSICPMSQNDAARLRALAADALTAATQMTDVNCKRAMMGVAASYERLASHAEQREASIARSDGPSEKRVQRRS